MTFIRRCLLVFSLPMLIAVAALRLGVAQQPPNPADPAEPVQVLPDPLQPGSGSTAGQAYSLPPEKLGKAIDLSRIRNVMDIVGSLWGLAVLWLLLDSRLAAGLESWAQRHSRRRWLQGLFFFAVLLVVYTLANLPLDVFGHHVSRDYEISVQGWPSWLLDQAKALGLLLVIGSPLLMLFHWIVRRWPRRYWIAAWVVSLPLLVLTVFVSPLLEPIFNTYEPLAKNHPILVGELEKVVARTGTNIPRDHMYLMKASEKSNGLNAYVTGLGATKRLVLWDTTTERLPDDEILFVFGHESGHYVLNHIPKMLAGMAIALFFVFWACAGFASWLVRHFGVRWQLNGPGAGLIGSPANVGAGLQRRAGFVVLLFAVSVANFVLEPAGNTFSRHFEHEADVYGQEAIHGIVPDPQKTAVAAFNALGEAWLEDPNPSPFIEFWEYSHPSVQTRANFALHYDPWANGRRGKFFSK
jgi:Zn-dependent protease with chaperone function